MSTDIRPQVDKWRSQLLDTSKRNRLISYKAGKSGAVRIVWPPPAELWNKFISENTTLVFTWKHDLIEEATVREPNDAEQQELPALFDPEAEGEQQVRIPELDELLESPRLAANHLLTDLSDKDLRRRLNRLAVNARESLTEQGVVTLHVAFGLLRWYESPDSGVELFAPLLIVPARLDRESVEAPWTLSIDEDDVLPNHCLSQMLTDSFGLSIPELPSDFDAADPASRLRFFEAVRVCIQDYKNWDVLDEAGVGIFSFQKVAMWADLGDNRDKIASHDLCRAIAGDAAVALRQPGELPTADQLDRNVHPRDTFHILDSDSSQHEAVEAVKCGTSLVLDGPPGTGKSQTIANIIAESLAAGKTVLFVSEKAAALEVVKRRLDAARLGDFCLECHSHKANKKLVIDELGRSLTLDPETYRDQSHDLESLHRTRESLNRYVNALHNVKQPLGMSAFQAHGRLAGLLDTPISHSAIPNVMDVDLVALNRLRDLLDSLCDFRGPLERYHNHPWRGCQATTLSLTLQADIQHHFKRLASTLGHAAAAAAMLTHLGFLAARPSLNQWLAGLVTAKEAAAFPLLDTFWFQAGSKQRGRAFIELDTAAHAYKESINGLGDFSPTDIAQLTEVDLAALSVEDAPLPRLLPHDNTTVRTCAQHLRFVSGQLFELSQCARKAQETAHHVIAALKVPVRALPAGGLSRFAEFASVVARLPTVRRLWLDLSQRTELGKIVERCQRDAKEASGLRAKLLDRLLPQALDTDNSGLAAQAMRFKSWFKRLFPSWRALRSRLGDLYGEALPPIHVLFDDMRELDAYHRRTEYERQIRARYADSLILTSEGEPEWQNTLQALQELERLTPLFERFPELKGSLIAEQINRDLLTTHAEHLAQASKSFRMLYDKVADLFDLRLASGEGRQKRLARYTAGDIANWLEAEHSAICAAVSKIEKLSALMVAGHDIELSAVPVKLGLVPRFQKSRERLARCRDQLALPGPLEAIASQDWGPVRSQCEWLLHFVDKYGEEPAAPLVRAATSGEFRSALAEVVQKNSAVRSVEFQEDWDYLRRLFDSSASVSTGITLDRVPLDELATWVSERVADLDSLREWLQLRDLERQLDDAKIDGILREVVSGAYGVEMAGCVFEARFLRLWLDAIYEREPALAEFASESHERIVARFKELDRGAIQHSCLRLRERLLNHSNRPRIAFGDVPGSSELGILLREVNKKRRHMPLRRLFASVPSLLLRLKPCLMMSPLAVSTYLHSEHIQFDLIIFDEASQVRPYDAISAIYRGRQLVVAGDQKQLPPTAFFERIGASDELNEDDDAESIESLADYESILDVCCTLGLPRRRLRWHYRSKREPLIAFSNYHFYDNDLVTFPSVHDTEGNPAVRFEFVPKGRWKAGASGGFNTIEARRAAELVFQHFRDRPEASLAVIAFSQRQQLAILDELEKLRRVRPLMEKFFDESRDEPFFVKNLENVQGDERDCILMSVGYGPDETGRVAMRFGPLNRSGGERRLNVAVTRARSLMTLVSSMRAHDIDLSRTTAVGAKLLRAYLDYAERGPAALGAEITEDSKQDFDSPFEREVAAELERRGFVVHRQIGCSGFRVDLALQDAEKPGRYVLGIECDGATYHSSKTARDRDRLRQEVLESLGWTICRIWSTDWIRSRQGQIDRVLSAYEGARKQPATKSPATHERQPCAVPFAGHAPVSVATITPGSGSSAIYSFSNIDEVPPNIIQRLIVNSLHGCGATPADELTQMVSRQLGFQRSGSRIKSKIEECLNGLVREGAITVTNAGLVRGNTPPRTERGSH